MARENWLELRQLFDAVCDLPPTQWKAALQRISDDPALIAEALALLEAQTVSFNRALQPLGELMAGLSVAELQAGDRLGAWQLVERLASGGMGTVFVAERADELFRQRVAIKLLRGSLGNPATAQRLAAERQILAELQHPNIARLYDGGTTPTGQPYLVMEYITGLQLDRYCEQHNPGLRERLRLFLRICRAVQAAHEQLIVHCDLKPSNVMIRANGEPVLLDFGIARLLGDADSPDASPFCTPAYASPELLSGARVGVASDVFGLGILLVELLAGRPTGRGVADRERAVAAPSVLAGADCAWRRQLRGDLDAIAAKACALDASRRYASVEALAQDIERHLDHRPVAARVPTWSYRFDRFMRRHWRKVAVAAAVGLLAVGFVWRLVEERARAEHESALAQQVSDFLVAAFSAVDKHTRRGQGPQELSARAVLDQGAARLDADLADSPDVLARLRFVLGRAYKNLGAPRRGEALLSQSVEGFLDRRVARPDLAAEALSELSALLSNDGREDAALAAAQRMLALRLQYGDDPVLLADSYNVLGLALHAKADYAQARGVFEQALALRREHLGPRHEEVAVSLHNLARLFRAAGDNAKSETFYRESLAIKRLHGERSAGVQSSLQGLALTVAAQARYPEALALLRENLAMTQALFGHDNGKVANAHSLLASVLEQAGEYAQARVQVQQAQAVWARIAGEDSLDYAYALANLAAIEEAQGDNDTAERLYRRVLAIRRAHLSRDALQVRRAEILLGHLLTRMDRAAEAQPLIEPALGEWQRQQHDGQTPSPDYLRVRLIHAEWLLRQGRFDAAAAALPAPLDGQPELMLQREALLVELAQRRGQWHEAKAHGLRTIQLSTGQAGADAVPTAKLRVPYAEVLLAAGEPSAARQQLRRAEPLLRAALVADAPLLLRIDALKRSLPATPTSG